MSFRPTQYMLRSVATGTTRSDEGGWTLRFSDEQASLIRAVYEHRQLTVHDDLEGLYRFADWLPVRRILEGSGAPVTYRSESLAGELGLEELWITFNGWWPEKGARMKTGTFKECEAFSVCGRMADEFPGVLVVASAGNTARAFARVCSDNRIPLLLFVPRDNLDALWFDSPVDDCVRMVCAETGGDYFDAIRMSNAAVAGSKRFIAEGGAANIARRDGMGTTVLSAVTTIGRIPDVYVQAVGSGTGAIAAWEAAMRFEADGRWGGNRMRLLVSQNTPFTPMVDSLLADSRDFLVADDEAAREQVVRVNAKVLTNRRPPWGIPGGLYDALKATGGSVLAVSNDEADEAARLFARTEGIDITDAAAVALASLRQAVDGDLVGRRERIMLNITGGGVDRFRSEHELRSLEPSIVLPLDTPDMEIAAEAERLFA